MLKISQIRAVSIDLDDTLWPIAPTIERAEAALQAWFADHAPMTAALFNNPMSVQAIRQHVIKTRPEIKHDLSAVRLEAIRLAMYRAGDNPLRAQEAFEVFFAERQRVVLYDDSAAALEFMSERYPMVSLSNGNADLERVGIARFFKAALSAKSVGRPKPHREIFDAAVAALGFPAAQILHVGDDIALDVVAAMHLGFQAVWVNRDDRDWPYDVQPHLTVRSLKQLRDVLAQPSLFQMTGALPLEDNPS
jgi:FMN hydrolase / 5-amino-6-(5-phospho-D-ribitylamino)uracil phosphatase